jgi:iron-sulfur cluster assembly accessory protein
MSTVVDVRPAVNLTESAAREIARAMSDSGQSPESFLRIGVAGGGCSGFQYSLGFDDKFDQVRDQLTEQHGIKVVVDKKSALYLDGTTLDHYDGIDRRGFVFNNPQAVKSCGCGSSFSA